MSSSERISPTAYATGHMWVRLGLSHPALSTPRGKRLDRAFSLAIQPGTLIGRPGAFDTLMLARHKGIDSLLEQAIEAGQITQVIEIAAGMSGRGWRMAKKYGDRLTYIEADLPHMAALKRRMLSDADLLTPKHSVVEIDALADDGLQSLAAITATLDQSQGLAIITEGLMNYLDTETAVGVWQRIAVQLKGFPHGLYLADAFLNAGNQGLSSRVIRTLLQGFVKGSLHVHYDSVADAERITRDAGFIRATLHNPADLPATRELAKSRGADRVHVLEAWV